MIEITLKLRSYDFRRFWVVEVIDGRVMSEETDASKELVQVDLDKYQDRIFDKTAHLRKKTILSNGRVAFRRRHEDFI